MPTTTTPDLSNPPAPTPPGPAPGTASLSGAAVLPDPTHTPRRPGSWSETFHLPFLSGDASESLSVWASDGLEGRP